MKLVEFISAGVIHMQMVLSSVLILEFSVFVKQYTTLYTYTKYEMEYQITVFTYSYIFIAVMSILPVTWPAR